MAAFLSSADQHAPLEVCIFNVGANVNFPLLETTERVFGKVWEMACYGGFLAGREAARSVERGTCGSPTLLVGDDIYFGKNRLGQVEVAIGRMR